MIIEYTNSYGRKESETLYLTERQAQSLKICERNSEGLAAHHILMLYSMNSESTTHNRRINNICYKSQRNWHDVKYTVQ